MNSKKITLGFVTAGLMNIIAILIFSKFFTNDVIPETDPVVMSNFGMLMIMVWGLAYISVSKSYNSEASGVKWLVLVFAIEKLIYGIAWILWLSTNSISEVYEQDIFAGVFFSIYGLNDLLFCFFFSYVFVKLWKG